MISDSSRNASLRRNRQMLCGATPPLRRLILSIVLGVALVAGTVWGVVGVVRDPMMVRWFSAADEAVVEWFHEHATPGLTYVMNVVTGLASTIWVTVVTLTAALGLVWKRCWYGLLFLGLAVPGGMALNVFLKASVHRARPLAGVWSPVFSGYAFPSGHTMVATLLYGTLAALAWRAIQVRRARWCAALAAGTLIGLVGWSRLQLGAHFLSDVLGGLAVGLAWLSLGFAAVDELRRRVARPGPPP